MPDRISSVERQKFLIAGATGNLGQRIALNLIEQGVAVEALVRRGSPKEKVSNLKKMDIRIHEVDFNNEPELVKACTGAHCVISALSGLRSVILDAQSQLLAAAVKAGVPRFIPSDYSIDFTKIP